MYLNNDNNTFLKKKKKQVQGSEFSYFFTDVKPQELVRQIFVKTSKATAAGC